MDTKKIFEFYPDHAEIEQWIESVFRLAEEQQCTAETGSEAPLNPRGAHHLDQSVRVIRFVPEHLPVFYGVWQPVHTGPAPLVVHLPGYGAEISSHADMSAQGYNVLEISPMGYWTPEGFDESKLKDGSWPVLPDTVESCGEHGYRDWLAECVMAVQWAWRQPQVLPDRVSFYGTSQGGGTALLLGSLFSGRGTRCVSADVPFLTNFPLADFTGAYGCAYNAFQALGDPAKGWHALGLVDTISHAYRMNFPVMIVQGGADETCPPETMEELYDALPGVRAKLFLPGQQHSYTREAIHMTFSWFRLYA